jgi:integrase
MSVYTRPDSPFYWLWLEGAGPAGRGRKERTKIRVDAPTPSQRRDNRELADVAYHRRMTEVASGAIRDEKPAITFATFAAWFIEHKLGRGRERELEILRRLRRDFGPLQLVAIDKHRVEEWMTARLARPTIVKRKKRTAPRRILVSASTVNREVDVLKAVLQAAVPKYLARSPIYGMKRLRTVTPNRRLMTQDEERRLLQVMAADDKALWLLAEDSLVRLSDVLDVKWEDDHGDRIWIADPKAGGGFEVPISKRTRQALAALSKNGSPYIFARRRVARTERDRRNGIRQMLERYCALVDPPIPFGRRRGGLTFHWATRRTGATRMLVNHVDIGTVQKIGRWKKPDVVLGIYHELIDEHARAAVDLVGRRSRHIPAGRKKRRKP